MRILKKIVILSISVSGSLLAIDAEEFNKEKFEQALTDKKTVVLAFHKDGCSACKAQDPNLRAVLKNKPEQSTASFIANIDESG